MKLPISLVCCDDSPKKQSRIVAIEVDASEIDARLLEQVEQTLSAGEQRDLHNAAHHALHGPVTYLQQVLQGGFSVFFGSPDDLQEEYFAAGSYVAFADDEGPGHGSRVGPDGVQRILRVLKGHLRP